MHRVVGSPLVLGALASALLFGAFDFSACAPGDGTGGSPAPAVDKLGTSTPGAAAQRDTAGGESRTVVAAEESWKNGAWSPALRRISACDKAGDRVEESEELWDGTTWRAAFRGEYAYDALHHQVAECRLRRGADDQWVLISGARDRIDTLDKDGNRVILDDAVWDSTLRAWVSGDSTLCDAKGRIVKTVSTDKDAREGSHDTLMTVESCVNAYQNDDVWIQTCVTRRSDHSPPVVEKTKYRKVKSSSGITVYAVDAWDSDMSLWISNAARDHRVVDHGKLVFDSLEEAIDSRFTPVYVYAESRDVRGALVRLRYWQKDHDEAAKTWSGKNYRLARSFEPGSGIFTSAESSFVWSQARGAWKLHDYENIRRAQPSGAGWDESGEPDSQPGQISRTRSCDTLLSGGRRVNFDTYWDDGDSTWTPGSRFSSSREGDSTAIVEESYNFDNDSWARESRITVHMGADGLASVEVEWHWVNGAPHGRWEPLTRTTYERKPAAHDMPQASTGR